MRDSSVQVNEVTRLYPVRMARVATPHTVEDISVAVKSSPGPISIRGGRYSMGGQTATPDGLQLDMREFHGVVAFNSAARTITVHSGARWREVQQAIDRAGLAVKIMQTYNTFTVGVFATTPRFCSTTRTSILRSRWEQAIDIGRFVEG